MPQALAAATTLGAVVLAVASPWAGEAADMWRAGAVILFSLGCYATGALPGHVVALLFFVAAMVFGVAPAEVVFSGFTSAALWLIFGGLILGVAIDRTGLGNRIARRCAGLFEGSYARVVAGIVFIGFALSFIMPSSLGRIVLFVPLAVALADELGFKPGSRGAAGIAVAAALGTFLPAFAILPANIPNLVLAGAAESLYGFEIHYGRYLLLHLPAFGVLKSVALIAATAIMFHDRPAGRTHHPALGPMTAAEKRLAIILGLAVMLWMTDFLHRVSPAWVGLAAGLLCFAPRIGMLKLPVLEHDIEYSSFFYVAGIISLGALVNYSGLGAVVGGQVLGAIPFQAGDDVVNYMSLSAISAVTGMLTTQPGIPAVLTPLAEALAQTTGLSLSTVLMVQVIGFSTVILPYQTPPLVIAAKMSGVRLVHMARMTLVLAVLTMVVLVPVNYLWWRLLGVVG